MDVIAEMIRTICGQLQLDGLLLPFRVYWTFLMGCFAIC